MQNVQLQISTEQLLEAIRQLPVKEQRKLSDQISQLPGQKKNGKRNGQEQSTLGEVEADLLARIRFYSHLPQKAQRRLNYLRRKRQAEEITDSELTELQALWSRVEWRNVERLEALIELAKLRGTDLDTLMHDLGLDKKRNVF